MEDYIQISTLNDFIFCPYSIYLHNIYADSDTTTYQAIPQTRGSLAHLSVDRKVSSHRKEDIMALSVYSERYHLMGKIDLYRSDSQALFERKYQLKQIFQGQIYQLWAQMFCLQEMGFPVKYLFFYEISTRKSIPVKFPNSQDIIFFEKFLKLFREYNPANSIVINPNKCIHCIYCNLCDKTETENVYT